MPEISGGTDEFDAGGELVVVGGFDVDNPAILVLLRAAVDDAEGLPDGYGRADNHQASVRADGLHLGKFAKKLGFALKGQDFHGNDEPEALASALHARRARRSLGFHTSRG